ncbi:dynein light chain binding protein [Aureococcus anophagefferens]|nr:dynein light chain binding protein [Aureococcus anophagefferens]
MRLMAAVLDGFEYRVDFDHFEQQGRAAYWPCKIAQQSEETARIIEKRFTKSLHALEAFANSFVQYEDLTQVKEAAARAVECMGKITAATEKARLYNSREVLFEREVTDYAHLTQIKKAFEPYYALWNTSQKWLESSKTWNDAAFQSLDAEAVESEVNDYSNAISKASKFFERNDMGPQASIAKEIKEQVSAFKPNVPIIVALRNKGMRERHWHEVGESLGMKEFVPDESFTLAGMLDLNPTSQIELITKVSEAAAKEFNIEQTLDKMLQDWTPMELQISNYRDTGTGVLKGVDEITAILDEHVTTTQAMQFSAFKGPFEERIESWNHKLYIISEVLDAWLNVQRNWMYLQPIFESPDINKQLPSEGRKFATVDKNWKQTISSAKSNPIVMDFCDNEKLLERLKDSGTLLDQVQKGLNDYLETKRGVFSRFYFLSNDDLLSILSESKDVMRVQPHFKKCFEAINAVEFQPDLSITKMISPEKEMVPMMDPVDPVGKNVEDWMLEVEAMMRTSIRHVMDQAIQDYPKCARTHAMHWTSETEQFFEEKGAEGPALMLERQLEQLDAMVKLVRGDLPKAARAQVGALAVIDVHARDVMKRLANDGVSAKADFAWMSQLRYYWDDGDLWAEMVAARRKYGYEYLGNSFRLVITPLTDKCYLTLMGALQMILGGAPAAGPAGTGKTETTKDLAKAVAMQCVVFNCSDGLDYQAMGKFFKGLASCGAWACFDEFNRINIEVLSVVGQQVMSIQLAIKGHVEKIEFEGSTIKVKDGFGVFITMNPGYAGRSALPDSLSALFRPVAMMVPDYALIGEIMFFAYGFAAAKDLGRKMVTTFKLCSEQCSSQPHYDYGMRAVKTVITAAGNLKRKEPESDEMILLLRALQDVNIPKFLAGDLPLFQGIISDLFPGEEAARARLRRALFSVMKLTIEEQGLQPHGWFIGKIVELYEMIVVRHGLMLVGPTGGGKSANLHVLENTLGELKMRGEQGFAYEKVKIYQLNPKSITMGQITTSDRKWVMFDGPVDAIWIENMNTVLDDNKKLCLVSGESVKMSGEMTMMFEVEDLLVASPATVSRVGIIYMEPKALGLDVLVQSWIEATLRKSPSLAATPLKATLVRMFDTYLNSSIAFVRLYTKELLPTMDNNLAQSLMRLMDCFLEPFEEKEGRDKPKQEDVDVFVAQVEARFIFSLVWSVGCTGAATARGASLKKRYHVMLVGETGTGKTVTISQYLQGSSKCEGAPIAPEFTPLTMTFSAQTSANMTQDTLDGKFEKRRRGVFGPPAGKVMAIHVDDLNMPMRETYGAQPPIEILRQWFSQEGWYDRANDLAFRRIVDVVFVASLGPPGGGRQEVTPRFVRPFNVVGLSDISDNSKAGIFGTILGNFLEGFTPAISKLTSQIVLSTINTFNTICETLLPTPSKSHYTFNLRDLAKVFQGVLMGNAKMIDQADGVVRLWVHELKRVFEDRLTTTQDHEWFMGHVESTVAKDFGIEWSKIMTNERLMYCDFLDPNADPRIYCEVTDIDQLKQIVNDQLEEHNGESKSPMPLVMFLDAIEHVLRIARILRQPQGNALLLGVGGSGRQSMSKMATYISGYQLFQVEIAKGYGLTEWRDDIRRCLLMAGVKDEPTAFVFSDAQVVMETFLEDINNILNAGDVPNLYGPEEMDSIMSACRIDCQKKQIPPTKINIFAQYIIRVRRNMHICLCMSPLGETFRERLRQFPSLVNCSTIDWFTEWPAEALESVGMSALVEKGQVPADDRGMVVKMFKKIHQDVEHKSADFWEMLRRHNYVTPTSYLELLSSFATLLSYKREEVKTKKDRLQIGLDKLTSTKDLVAGMQEELVALQPQLVTKGKEVDEMMIVIDQDKKAADEVKAKVLVEEEKANGIAERASAIAADAQKDLDEALPALDAAVQCLKELKKAHIDEVKALRNPPGGVRLTMEVACLYFEVAAIKKADPNQPGKKIEDFFEPAQKVLLSDANRFLKMLQDYDKDHIPDKVIKKVSPYMSNPDFTVEQVEKASVACRAICMWAHAMHKYHFVALGVAPKKAKHAEATAELDSAMAVLNAAQSRLKEVVDKLDKLEQSLKAAVDEKQSLADKEIECKTRLSNADKLIGGLGGEQTRWAATVEHLSEALENCVGDVLVSAGTVSYLGPFTSEFRKDVVDGWQSTLGELGIKATPGCDLVQTLVEPVKLRMWQMYGLPTDNLSTQNGIMLDRARRWSLFIDPQGQANRFLRTMAKDKEMCKNGFDVTKLSDKNFLRTLENAVRFGKWALLENIGETLDAALEPILLQQTFKQGGQDMMKLGESTIPYNEEFRLFLTTKMPNPHYSPEVQLEMPDLAEKKSQLVVQQAQMNKQLFDIESEILLLLSNSTGNILDDTNLIETLAQAKKKTSDEVQAKMKDAEITTVEVNKSSEEYRPVAKRASLLYFCLADLANVDPMYQYALPWFKELFATGVKRAPMSNKIEERIVNLNEFFTYFVYTNVCRSLFERHKLLFSFLATIKIMMGDDKVDQLEWRFVISGQTIGSIDLPNPDPDWIEPNVWSEIKALGGLNEAFAALPAKFGESLAKWKRSLCILRCLRRDKLMDGVQLFVAKEMHQKYTEPPPFDLPLCFDDSSNITPLVFVLSTGSDPNKDILELAERQGMLDKMTSIALGQGQGKIAEKLIDKSTGDGSWVSVKMTKEPPRGLRANLKTTFLKMNDEGLSATNKPSEYRNSAPLGWNVGYTFNETDLDICIAQLELYVNQYDDIPYAVLSQLTSVVNYGGRITDDKDMRTADIIVSDFMTPQILADNYRFSRSGTYYSIAADESSPLASYLDYIDSLPMMPEPEVFGMHDNASITFALNEADENCAIIQSLQPRTSGGGGMSREDVVAKAAQDMEATLPVPWDVDAVYLLYPTAYDECLNTTIVQEVTRFTRLGKVMVETLKTFQLALKGLVVLSSELEAMGNFIYDGKVPELWSSKAYPSLKPLPLWYEDLLKRLTFLQGWIDKGIPDVLWISVFFFPQGFMTANVQNFARRTSVPVDTVEFGHILLAEAADELVAKPRDGCYVNGLFLEGARWDKRKKTLTDPRPKELFAPMPVIHLLPQVDRETPTKGIYRCPVYKILTRTGTLSTTGHSTNFVFWLEVPSNKVTIFRNSLVSETNAQVKLCDQSYWIKAGCACFCALKY